MCWRRRCSSQCRSSREPLETTSWQNIPNKKAQTSSKMCRWTTFCAKAWSASRRLLTSSSNLSKAALVGTSRVCPSFSASSPTSSDILANSSSCRNLENSFLPFKSWRMERGFGSRTLSRVYTTPDKTKGSRQVREMTTLIKDTWNCILLGYP